MAIETISVMVVKIIREDRFSSGTVGEGESGKADGDSEREGADENEGVDDGDERRALLEVVFIK